MSGERLRQGMLDTKGLPLYTTNPGDFAGLESVFAVMRVTQPPVPHERPS
jgi:hypothetical protein